MNELHRILTSVAVSAASAAMVCVLLAPAPPAPPARAELDWTPLHRLADRVQALEHAPEAVHAEVPSPSTPESREPVRTDAAIDLVRRIDAIELRMLRLEQVDSATLQLQRYQDGQASPDKEEAARRIVDPGLDVAAKVRAHEALRGVPDAYSPAMVAELLKIATMNPDGRVRADVWCFFDGKSRLPAIVAPLVRALQSDADARAREEAADTLGSYLDDPIVEPALKRAAESDASESVRTKANRTLKTRRSFSPVGQAGR